MPQGAASETPPHQAATASEPASGSHVAAADIHPWQPTGQPSDSRGRRHHSSSSSSSSSTSSSSTSSSSSSSERARPTAACPDPQLLESTTPTLWLLAACDIHEGSLRRQLPVHLPSRGPLPAHPLWRTDRFAGSATWTQTAASFCVQDPAPGTAEGRLGISAERAGGELRPVMGRLSAGHLTGNLQPTCPEGDLGRHTRSTADLPAPPTGMHVSRAGGQPHTGRESPGPPRERGTPRGWADLLWTGDHYDLIRPAALRGCRRQGLRVGGGQNGRCAPGGWVGGRAGGQAGWHAGLLAGRHASAHVPVWALMRVRGQEARTCTCTSTSPADGQDSAGTCQG